MVKVYEERSKSRSGIHMLRKTYLVVDMNCSKLSVAPTSRRSIKTSYSKGEAFEDEIKIPKGYFAVQMVFVRGLKGRVKGEIIIYDSDGNKICRAVYRKLKVRVLECEYPSQLLNIIKCVASLLKIPVKRYAIIRGQRAN